MVNDIEQVAVLIPAYNPDEKLVIYVGELLAADFTQIIVVDDGSRKECEQYFEQIEQEHEVTVLHHKENQGKGRALKTGFTYCLEHFPDCVGVVTADSDGQHSAKDTVRVAQKLQDNPDQMILGTRNFDEPGVPFKSKSGNKITTVVFALLHGAYLRDTQTGLRGIGKRYLEECCSLQGERFEYEINMLVYAAHHKIPFKEVLIETIYIDDNKETHFRPFQDSMKIYGVILRTFFQYLFSSLSASLIDLGVFTICNMVLFTSLQTGKNVLYSTIVARILSSLYNFIMNQRVVFRSHGNVVRKAMRYYALVVVQMALSAGLVFLFVHLLSCIALPVKVVVDTVLFLISFQIQKRFVFV